MAIDIYSKREALGKEPDIFIYDSIPKKFRVQVHHIIKDTIGRDNYGYSNVRDIYNIIQKLLIKEYGVFYLSSQHYNPETDVLEFLLETKEYEKALDVIELCFYMINTFIKERYHYASEAEVEMNPENAIIELNERFKENGIGYVFESNKILRVDSTFTYSEITKPTLKLLSNSLFKNANEEYLKAHDHYRHGRNKECLAECLKAFESVMKIICKTKKWSFQENDTSSKLIKICFDKGLVPDYLQTQLTSLRSLLEAGIPTIRNRVAGHGQGDQKKEASDHLVRYALNLTGSNIIFLIELSGIV